MVRRAATSDEPIGYPHADVAAVLAVGSLGRPRHTTHRRPSAASARCAARTAASALAVGTVRPSSLSRKSSPHVGCATADVGAGTAPRGATPVAKVSRRGECNASDALDATLVVRRGAGGQGRVVAAIGAVCVGFCTLFHSTRGATNEVHYHNTHARLARELPFVVRP